MTIRLRACLAALMLVLATPVAAQNFIDQNQPLVTGDWVWIGQWTHYGVYQTFKQSTGHITGAGFFLAHDDASAGHPYFGGALVTISLYDHPEGSVLASASAVATSTGWVDAYWAALSVTPGQQYALRITSNETDYGLLAEYGGGSPYAGGNAWIFHDYFDLGGGTSYGGADMTFRTYTDISSSTVPEPGSFALLGSGLVGLLGVAARRARR